MFCNKYEVEVYVGGQSGTFEGPSMELIKSMRTYILLIQLFLSLFIVPKSLDTARSYLRDSNIDYFPSLIKSKKFIDAVNNLTIFITYIKKLWQLL